jgi:branched-chain amino acid transport system permease protein
MLKRFIERFSWVDFFLKLFQVAAIVVLVVGIYRTVGASKYTSGQWVTLIFAGLAQGSIYALIALGYTLVYGILLMINFAHGDVYMAGAFTAVFLANSFAASGFLAAHPVQALTILMIFAALVSMVLNIIVERVAYRPLRNAPRLVP